MTRLSALVQRSVLDLGLPLSKDELAKLQDNLEQRVIEAQRGFRITLSHMNIVMKPLEDTAKTEQAPVYEQTRAAVFGPQHVSAPTEAELADLRTYNDIMAIKFGRLRYVSV